LKWLCDLHGFNAHLQGQCPTGHVVRPLDGCIRRRTLLGILLALQHVLGESAKGLRHEHYPGTCRVLAITGNELGRCPMNFHSEFIEDLCHAGGRGRVMLRGRNYPRVRSLGASGLHRFSV
jgi:hypothetical protein